MLWGLKYISLVTRKCVLSGFDDKPSCSALLKEVFEIWGEKMKQIRKLHKNKSDKICYSLDRA